MKALSFIYSGYYYFFVDSKLSSRPDFSAWASCSIATLFYVFSILTVIDKLYNDGFGDREFPFGVIVIAAALAIGLLSDWRIEHTWFGARAIEMHGRQRTLAKLVSLSLFAGSGLAYISVGFIMYP